MITRASFFLLLLCCTVARIDAQVLDARAILSRQTQMDNRDVDWFAERIPVFESPDTAIDATYYYRWDLITRHLTYGSERSGYTFTEFIDRPFWSGAYGAISCPLGHQFAEVRWLNDRRIIDDFTRYWFETPGAQPRSYSNWYASALWGVYEVLGDTTFLRSALPYMKAQYAGWVAEHWDSTQRMFRWDGLHDGMERNINSRQTTDIDEGAEGYRPTLNSYLYGDMRAIARASRVFGDSATSRVFDARADSLRQRVEQELWDERREFFLHQFAHDEPDGVRALSRTYETGKYAGDPHGRELIGYVPWQFDLPEAGKGYERAWRFLMDTAYFAAPFGPTTTERHDPQFIVSPRCCWWSGNSWPYATTQTLDAMANLLNDYTQNVVTSADWMRLFETYTHTQRKNGRPYVAEGANPFTGSWEGFDTPYHSEHYFHSAYVDLVITGVVGLRPRADDTVEVNPLAPRDWSYFALDDVPYHGHRLSIVWDATGRRYHKGKGLTITADGIVIGHANQLGRLKASAASVDSLLRRGCNFCPRYARAAPNAGVNVLVNNDGNPLPWLDVSYAAPQNPPTYLNDGNYWYMPSPPNRWTTIGSPHAQDTVTITLGAERLVDEITLYFVDDGEGSAVRAPSRVALESWLVDHWERKSWPPDTTAASELRGHRATRYRVDRHATRLRLILTPRPGAAVGLSEIEAWAASNWSLPAHDRSPDVAFGARASASYTSQYDRVSDVNDLRVAFTRYSRNRWTSYGSPNASDWLQLDFASPQLVRTIELYLWGDDAGVKAPRAMAVQVWSDSAWHDATVVSRQPEQPMTSARNVITIQPARTSRVRVVFTHDLPAASGVTEMIVR